MLIACGGVAGATVRWSVAEALGSGSFPWATFAANIVGSSLLAWITTSNFSQQTRRAVGMGFCGGLTTFSTFSVEVVELAEDGRPVLSAIYLAASILAALAAFATTRFLVGGRSA